LLRIAYEDVDGDRDRHAGARADSYGRPRALASSAVDSAGAVTNPGYPLIDRDAAVAFHRRTLERALDSEA
jgi:hypothetical protein